MTSFVADTHAILWHLSDPRRLGKAARRAFSSADSGAAVCYLPVIALIEITMLYERGRLRLSPVQVLDAVAAHPGYLILALDIQQAVEFSAHPAIKDPMDRLVVAAARATNSRLITADERLQKLVPESIWE